MVEKSFVLWEEREQKWYTVSRKDVFGTNTENNFSQPVKKGDVKGGFTVFEAKEFEVFCPLILNHMYFIPWLSFHGCFRLCVCERELGGKSQPILPIGRVFRVFGAGSYYLISLDLCSSLPCYRGIITSLLQTIKRRYR